ncbi:tRNA 5-methoxyuridine(34)/uridine 5-oxyacetic acid(34) synthase CmoB [Pseudoalteromonas denitrificans]|uniref:tRNA U34 carboxymethyltransferase n=1 Tax=Pseudoalteromonas denitrificans DSM 6059 TaxID=1123010 RepID=A0A1I1IR98_9GAMM|nr:tRNA 5-methoxyuridine(34)/uridine 5-oxyacetic acid(34) synthase CmoB [Pseudoalteromonas denitrificans]SFC38817.1 tRNA (mo5U34)-methyltransferase [Pseudoalteromonas denitrificans DSM 6059]
MNNWFNAFYAQIAQTDLSPWLETLPSQLRHWQKDAAHGDMPKWEKVLKNLPQTETQHINITDKVEFGLANELSTGLDKKTTHLLKRMMPWRKGPYFIHGIHIDTEWRSDWKWERLLPHISPLSGKTVLDIGCGSGYHLWRMRGEGANFVVGIDPTDLFLCQFQAIKHFNPDPLVHLIPVGVEALPELKAFDTVFSMGVLYHRRSPIDFLAQLKAQLKPGGELVLETLVIEGDEQAVLMPTDRYAKMRNVWYIPSCEALKLWMTRVGFKDIKVVNEDTTTLGEQRATDWMETESLEDFLDPDDKSKTIEGYPAPRRAIFIAKV